MFVLGFHVQSCPKYKDKVEERKKGKKTPFALRVLKKYGDMSTAVI